MKRILLIALCFICLAASGEIKTTNSTPVIAQATKTKVLVCTSEKAYAYHKGYCAGLKRCKAKVSEVTVEQAKKMGKGKACGYCYK